MLSSKVVTKQQVIYYICIYYQFVLPILFVYYSSNTSYKQLVSGKKTVCLELPATFLNCVLPCLCWGWVGVIVYYNSQTWDVWILRIPKQQHCITSQKCNINNYTIVRTSKTFWIKKAKLLSSIAFLWFRDQSSITALKISHIICKAVNRINHGNHSPSDAASYHRRLDSWRNRLLIEPYPNKLTFIIYEHDSNFIWKAKVNILLWKSQFLSLL